MKLFRNLTIFASLLSLCGCGYFGDKPVEDSEIYRSDKLANSCQIDVEQLSKILEEDVEKQISCLEENLINFSRYVRRDNQAFVTDSELKSFVKRFFKSHANLIVGSMTLIFDINSLFLKDARNSISSKNIKPLFNLLRITNREISKIFTTLEKVKNKEAAVEDGRAVLEESMKNFGAQVKSIISQAGGAAETSIDLEDFYDRLTGQFDQIEMSEELFDGILGLKKLFLGGKRNRLTRDELFVILDHLPSLSSAAFSLIYAAQEKEGDLISQYEIYEKELEEVTENLFHHRREEEIFRKGEVEGLISKFFEEDSDVYVDLLSEYKSKILQNKRTDIGFTYADVRNTISLGRTLIKGLIFFEEFKELIPNKDLVTKSNWKSFKESSTAMFLSLRDDLRKELGENVYFPSELEVFDFIDIANEKFNRISIPNKIIGILPIGKVALVGGDKGSITKLEVLNIIDKSEKLAQVFFDFNYANEKNHSTQEMSGLYYRNLKTAKFLLTGQQYLHVGTVEELLQHVGNFISGYDVAKYLVPVQAFKEKIVGGYPSSITVSDVAKLLDLTQGYFARNYFFDVSFDVFKPVLESGKKITYLRHRHHPAFKDFSPDEVIKLKKEFQYIISTYRLFRNDEGTVYIGKKYERTKKGILEIHMIQYLYNLVAKGFGHSDPNNGLPALNIDEINNLQYLLEPALRDIGMWSAFPETFARNILLLADLFQSRSNGNLSMDVIEATEYGVLALFAIQTAEKVVNEIKKEKCEWKSFIEEREDEEVELEGFDLNCYRPLLFDTLFDKLGLRKRLPKLASYIDSIPYSEAINYVTSVEGFARESQDPNRPQTQKDIVLLIGAMMNIESTYLRYDTDNSNFVEPSELDEAFPVYEEAIMMLAGLDESKRHFAPSIFKYMIKNMSIPTPVQVGIYHYNIFDRKKVGSKRLNIGSLLYNLILQAAKKAEEEAEASAQ